MTPEQHREYATEIMRDQAHHWDQAAISDRLGLAGGRFAARDVDAIVDLIRTANVEITWPDEDQPIVITREDLGVPVCHARHPGFAPGKIVECGLTAGHDGNHRSLETGVVWLPEVLEWERELLERQAAEEITTGHTLSDCLVAVTPYITSGAPSEPAGLTPAQEIRSQAIGHAADFGYALNLVDLGPTGVGEAIVEMSRVFADWVDTGEADYYGPTSADWESLEASLRGQLADANADAAMAMMRIDRVAKVLDEVGMALPASDAAQLRAALEWVPEPNPLQAWADGFKEQVLKAAGEAFSKVTRAGYSETLRVPGTDEAVVLTGDGFEPVVTAADPGGLLNDSGTPPEADEPVKQTAHPHSDTQTGSTALHGPAPLGGTANVADGETP